LKNSTCAPPYSQRPTPPFRNSTKLRPPPTDTTNSLTTPARNTVACSDLKTWRPLFLLTPVAFLVPLQAPRKIGFNSAWSDPSKTKASVALAGPSPLLSLHLLHSLLLDLVPSTPFLSNSLLIAHLPSVTRAATVVSTTMPGNIWLITLLNRLLITLTFQLVDLAVLALAHTTHLLVL